MRDIIERLEGKVDLINAQLSEIKVVIAKQEVNLMVHMKRSEMLEKQMEPIKKHVAMVNGAMKLIGLMSTLTAIVVALVEIIKRMK